MIIWELLTWLLFGLIVGFIANLIDPHKEEGGFLGYVILGILGSIVGGYLAQVLGIRGGTDNDFSFSSIITAVIGSLLVLFVYRMIKGGMNKTNR